MCEIHPENGIAWLEQGIVDSDIGGSSAQCLYVGMVGMKEFFGPLDRDVFGHIGELLSAIVASPWKPFSIFVSKYATEGLTNSRGGVVLRGD